MKIQTIEPAQFTTVPWKNGLGETIEMAINPGGTLADFDWRLSMASVVEDGLFSNFAGYTRNLILISGDGINLQHNDNEIQKLPSLLDFATFDGGNKTVGNLVSGEITDFNVIARTERYQTEVFTAKQHQHYPLAAADLCFIYSLSQPVSVQVNNEPATLTLVAQHLMQITELGSDSVELSGEDLILVYLRKV